MSTDDKLMIGQGGVDPLTTGADAARELFNRYSQASNGFPFEAAIGAAGNIILNTLRQNFKTRKEADEALQRLLEKLRQSLDDHYDHAGNRRNIFPFNQEIVLDEVVKFNRKANGRAS